MSTINAQVIITAVMQAHAVAPDDASDYITFQTSARGTHRIINDKKHLQRFADLVRKNAKLFGGGLEKESKPRPAVSYPSKTISLYKQLIEDKDWYAALQLAEDKLSPMFALCAKGTAVMFVAPIPCDSMPDFVSAMHETGIWAVLEPASMREVTRKNKRSRDAQIAYVQTVYNNTTDKQKARVLYEAHSMRVDQNAIRAQWMLEHFLTDGKAIAARIEAQAAQDVAEVVAQAVAVSAIAEAMAPAVEPEDTPELVTCEAGESEAQTASTGSASSFTVAAYNTVTAMLASFTPTHTPAVAVSSEPPTPGPMESTEITAPEPVPAIEIEADTTAAESQPEHAPHAAVITTTLQELLDGSDFKPLAFALNNRGCKFQKEFTKVTGIEAGCKIKSREQAAMRYMGEKKAASNVAIIQQNEPVAPVVETESTPGRTLKEIGEKWDADMKAARMEIEAMKAEREATKRANAAPTEPAQLPDDYAKFNIRAKSGAWFASVYMIGTMYGLRFDSVDGHHGCTAYATHAERMQALEAMARATTPPDSPPDGGQPVATFDAPTEAHTSPVAECTPDTQPAVSRVKPEHDLKVGDVVRSSWGYDQTNVNHYQITKVIGKRTVEVRELAGHKEKTGDMSGSVAPVWGEFVGEPMRRTVDKHGHVNILREKFGRASKIEPVAVVHGVRCYASTGYSSYA